MGFSIQLGYVYVGEIEGEVKFDLEHRLREGWEVWSGIWDLITNHIIYRLSTSISFMNLAYF